MLIRLMAISISGFLVSNWSALLFLMLDLRLLLYRIQTVELAKVI